MKTKCKTRERQGRITCLAHHPGGSADYLEEFLLYLKGLWIPLCYEAGQAPQGSCPCWDIGVIGGQKELLQLLWGLSTGAGACPRALSRALSPQTAFLVLLFGTGGSKHAAACVARSWTAAWLPGASPSCLAIRASCKACAGRFSHPAQSWLLPQGALGSCTKRVGGEGSVSADCDAQVGSELLDDRLGVDTGDLLQKGHQLLQDSKVARPELEKRRQKSTGTASDPDVHTLAESAPKNIPLGCDAQREGWDALYEGAGPLRKPSLW